MSGFEHVIVDARPWISIATLMLATMTATLNIAVLMRRRRERIREAREFAEADCRATCPPGSTVWVLPSYGRSFTYVVPKVQGGGE